MGLCARRSRACAHEDGTGKYGCAHEDHEDLGGYAHHLRAHNGSGNLEKVSTAGTNVAQVPENRYKTVDFTDLNTTITLMLVNIGR